VVKAKHLVIVLLLAVVAILAARHFLQGEEKRVRKSFRLLSKWVGKKPGENVITTASKIQSIGTLFAENFNFKGPINSLSGGYTRQEISSHAAWARSQFSRASLRFYDLDIVFPEEDRAKVTLTARLTGLTKGEEHIDETRELECLLKKAENKWLFTDCQVVEVLKR
jgi:hypothetical protein